MKAQNNKPDHVKIASVTTLGYICEEIDPDIIQDKSNMILTAVIEGMKWFFFFFTDNDCIFVGEFFLKFCFYLFIYLSFDMTLTLN